MKATIDGKALAKGLALIDTVLPKRANLPVLTTILVTATRPPEIMEPGTLELMATDLDQTITVRLQTHINEPGVRCVNGAKLIQIVKELAGGEVRLGDDGSPHGIHVRAGGGRWLIHGLLPDDYPTGGPALEAPAVVVKADSLAAALKSVVFAVSSDEHRPALNGVRVLFAGKQATLNATDGHRLITITLPLEKGLEGDPREAIVPAATVRSMLALVAGHTDVELRLDQNRFTLDVDGGRLAARLVEGAFPNVEAVVKPLRDHTGPLAVLSARALMAGLRQVSVMADDRNHASRLRFRPQHVVLEAQTADHGEAEVQLPVEYLRPLGAEELTLGVNAGYLLDYLGLVPGDVTIALKDSLAPLLLNGRPTEDGVQTAPEYVVMPMRI